MVSLIRKMAKEGDEVRVTLVKLLLPDNYLNY